jgi:hypothetical protein
VGIELDPAKLSADGLYVITNWKAPRARVVHTSPGASAATLEGRAATLREKLRRYRSEEEAIWRRQMASAFMVTLGARDRERCKAAVLERCQQIGENEFARTVLWPMIDAKVGARTLARFSG